MKGTYIGEFEELVLLSVGILFDDAYGLTVVDELEKQTGRSIMISSVHKALVRLEDKGFLKSKMEELRKVVVGERKGSTRLTHAGVGVLRQSRELRNSMWKQMPRVVLDGSV